MTVKRVLLFTVQVREAIMSIPHEVAAYGQIAALAGDARQGRQVAWECSPEGFAFRPEDWKQISPVQFSRCAW